MIQHILNYQLITPVPWPYVLIGLAVVLLVGITALRRIIP